MLCPSCYPTEASRALHMSLCVVQVLSVASYNVFIAIAVDDDNSVVRCVFTKSAGLRVQVPTIIPASVIVIIIFAAGSLLRSP